MDALLGHTVILRQLNVSDVTDRYLKWFDDADVVKYLELATIPQDHGDLEQFVEQCIEDPSTILFGIFQKDSGLHIGNVKLGPRNSLHETAPLGILIGERSFWNRGIATEAISLASEWALRSTFCRKVTAGCISNNLGSIRAFRKASFEIEGIQRQQVRRRHSDERDDVILLGKCFDMP